VNRAGLDEDAEDDSGPDGLDLLRSHASIRMLDAGL